jgi:hypothetical protein
VRGVKEMSGELKSSLDIAMEKMNRMVGKDTVNLTDDQKQRIAEVRREYEAKVAEKKILLAGSSELTAELQKLHQEEEEKVEAIYRESQKER